jgi:hypothetical protein
VRIEAFTKLQDDRPSGWVLPNEHLSVTQLNAFLRCERAYQHQYILGEKPPASSDQVLGSAVHGAIAWAALQVEPVVPDEAGAYFREYEWPNQVEDSGGVQEITWDNSSEVEAFPSLGARMVEVYAEQVIPRLEVAEVEKRFELSLPGVPIPIVGFLDIVQQGTRPAIDIKTSKRAQNTILPGWLLQGRVYQLAEERDIDWHVLTKQVSPQVVTCVQSPALLQTYSEVQARRTVEIVERLAWRINHCYAIYGEDRDWNWTGVSHTFACTKCHWRGDCPGWEGTQ